MKRTYYDTQPVALKTKAGITRFRWDIQQEEIDGETKYSAFEVVCTETPTPTAIKCLAIAAVCPPDQEAKLINDRLFLGTSEALSAHEEFITERDAIKVAVDAAFIG